MVVWVKLLGTKDIDYPFLIEARATVHDDNPSAVSHATETKDSKMGNGNLKDILVNQKRPEAAVRSEAQKFFQPRGLFPHFQNAGWLDAF